MRKILAVSTVVLMLLALIGYSNYQIKMEKKEETKEKLAILDEVIEVSSEELSDNEDDLIMMWELSDYGLYELNQLEKIYDYYLELRDVKSINDANDTIKQHIEKEYVDKSAIELYKQFYSSLLANSSTHNILKE